MEDITEIIKISKDTILCREGDDDSDLYMVSKGSLLICSRSGHMVTPLAYVKAGEYFGEMSFFDNKKRSADVISLEDTTLIRVPTSSLKDQVPTWLLVMAKRMTHKLRIMGQVIKDKGIKRHNVVGMKPLSIEQQRHYYELLTKFLS
ncbi:MAG: cyclic nucleotide-binding domain-containing protein [Halobacteriovoraceae bacterium]|jgi:CRP/FNR family transcriptional regulator, cyclic AMP receptor protein|nr:cyclic nucleotide-binding domain-containing protein [Halobacteriovoraceae bacterium]